MEVGGLKLGKVEVSTTTDGGHPPEYWAERCADRMVMISAKAPQPVRDQAIAYKDELKLMIYQHIKRAILSDRNTLAVLLEKEGYPDVAKAIRRLKGKLPV